MGWCKSLGFPEQPPASAIPPVRGVDDVQGTQCFWVVVGVNLDLHGQEVLGSHGVFHFQPTDINLRSQCICSI